MLLPACTLLQPPPPRPAPPQQQSATRVEPARPEPARAEPRAEVPPRITESEQLNSLIGYAQGVAAMAGDDQRKELAGANLAFTREPQNAAARLKLAMLLCLPGTVIADDGRALNLLEPMASNTTGAAAASAGALRRFSGLLYAQLSERLKEQKRSAQLQQQLDALKAMERSLMERGQGRGR